MLSLTSLAVDALSSSTVAMVQLVYLGFPTPIGLNTSNYDFTYNGILYKGAYGLGSVSDIEDSPGEIKGIQFTLTSGSAEMVSLALDGSKQWQGIPVVLRNAVLGENYEIVDCPVVWSGRGDTLAIQESDGTCIVQATAESSAVDLVRSHPLFYSDADQKMLFPGDEGISLLLGQVESPVVWPAKSWYYR